MLKRFAPIVLVPLLVALPFVAGCPGGFGDLEEIEIDVDRPGGLGLIQDIFAPPGFSEEIIIEERVEIIEDINEPIFVEDPLDIVVLGFENLTTFDIYLRYVIGDPFEGEYEQGVLVFDEELLLLEYPCFDYIELLSEEDFDPFTGEFVPPVFDLTGIFFERGFDFFCGDTLIITITPDEIFAEAFPF